MSNLRDQGQLFDLLDDTLDAFARARARAFDLLGQQIDPGEQLGFADFVMGSALQPS